MKTLKWALSLVVTAVIIMIFLPHAVAADTLVNVPEPTSILLLASGLAGLGGFAVYKKIKK